MKRLLPTAVVLALLLGAGWLLTRLLRPDPRDDEITLPDTTEGHYARRLIEASLKEGQLPEPMRVADLLNDSERFTGQLVIVIGTVARADGKQVDLESKSLSCRALFLNPPNVQPGDAVAVGGDCRG